MLLDYVLSVLESSEAISCHLSFLYSGAVQNPSVRNTSSLGHKHPVATDHHFHCGVPLPACTLLLMDTDVCPGHGCPPGTSTGTGILRGPKLHGVLCLRGRVLPPLSWTTLSGSPKSVLLLPRNVIWTSSTPKNHLTYCLPAINENITKGPFFNLDKPTKCFAVGYPEQSHTGVRFYSSTCSDLPHSRKAINVPGCQRHEKFIQNCFR